MNEVIIAGLSPKEVKICDLLSSYGDMSETHEDGIRRKTYRTFYDSSFVLCPFRQHLGDQICATYSKNGTKKWKGRIDSSFWDHASAHIRINGSVHVLFFAFQQPF